MRTSVCQKWRVTFFQRFAHILMVGLLSHLMRLQSYSHFRFRVTICHRFKIFKLHCVIVLLIQVTFFYTFTRHFKFQLSRIFNAYPSCDNTTHHLWLTEAPVHRSSTFSDPYLFLHLLIIDPTILTTAHGTHRGQKIKMRKTHAHRHII